MTASNKLRAFTLLMAIVVVGTTSNAMAFCSSCGVAAPAYSAGYAPVAYQAAYAPAYTASYAPAYTAAYAPAYTTAYAPAYTTYNSGWYPGRFLGRVNRSIWGQPTTTYYAPAYTAAYAPTYSVGYAPAVAYAAPACSTCSASYAPAPACSTCSACTASYAPACSSCSTCDACSAGVTVTEGVAAAPCPNCSASAVAPAAYTEAVVSPPPASTYGTSATTPPATNEPTPALPQNLDVPAERSIREADKPLPADPLELEPKAQPADDSATNLQAPKLFDPSDNTAARHPAPVWTAVYHRVSGSDTATAQPISYQQAQEDAAGWTSGSN
jgi:hypothetical protein